MSASTKPSTSHGKAKEKKSGKPAKGTIFTKRAGTSGIRGQLYETKLLGLIYFKALNDEEIEEFYLATNVDGLGMFDDICLRAKIKEFKKPINVFIQAKHRENDRILMLNNMKDLSNYFDSYLRIKRRFLPNNDDVLFKGTFCDTDCIFVMYTTAKDDGSGKICESNLIKYLNKLIGTGNPGCQPSYTDEDLILLCQQVLEEQLVTLAVKLARYILDDADQIMNDELVLRYHFILAQEVFNISDITSEGHRIASFRTDFFSVKSQKCIQIFKDVFCSEILERRKIDIKNEAQDLLARFLTDTDDNENLRELIRGNIITFKNGNLEFRDKMLRLYDEVLPLHHYKAKLDEINQNNVNLKYKAVELAVKKCLNDSLEFKVPPTFGNKDLAIRGSDAKIEKRLGHVCKKLNDLIEKADGKIITIDDSMEDGFLRLNGGIASAMGNLIVFDENSNLFKLSEDYESLECISKRFHTLLKSKIENVHEYKFDMRAKVFPKLVLNRSDHNEHAVVKDFVSKLVFYTNQGDENEVEKKIIDEIEQNRSKQEKLNNPKMKSEAIFLRYHDEIQKWWMTSKEGRYLTKESELYNKAIESTSVVNMMPEIKFSQHVVCVEEGRIVESYDPTERKRDEESD